MLSNFLVGVSLVVFAGASRKNAKIRPVSLFLLAISGAYALLIQIFTPQLHPQFEYALFVLVCCAGASTAFDYYLARANSQ